MGDNAKHKTDRRVQGRGGQVKSCIASSENRRACFLPIWPAAGRLFMGGDAKHKPTEGAGQRAGQKLYSKLRKPAGLLLPI